MKKNEVYGFGYEPKECLQHFLIDIPKNNSKTVNVYERYVWDDAEIQTSQLEADCKCKIKLSKEKWLLVKPAIEDVLNSTLKATNRKIGRFKIGQTPIERLLGKEMMVLLWAIEACDKSVIDRAILNWKGLSREERWWLFTMTNASTGLFYQMKGWRIALRYAITENPVIDKTVTPMFDELLAQL